jgi:hypothetical protein
MGSWFTLSQILARQSRRQEYGFFHACFIRFAGSGNIVGGAVVDGRSDKRRPQRQRHAAEKVMQLERY